MGGFLTRARSCPRVSAAPRGVAPRAPQVPDVHSTRGAPRESAPHEGRGGFVLMLTCLQTQYGCWFSLVFKGRTGNTSCTLLRTYGHSMACATAAGQGTVLAMGLQARALTVSSTQSMVQLEKHARTLALMYTLEMFSCLPTCLPTCLRRM